MTQFTHKAAVNVIVLCDHSALFLELILLLLISAILQNDVIDRAEVAAFDKLLKFN